MRPAVVRQTVRRAGVAFAAGGYAQTMDRRTDTEAQGDYKNALPDEVTDHPDSGMPRQLRTQADDDAPLTRREADAAGISPTPEVVYADSDEDPNRDDQRDVNRAGPDEHV